MFGIPEAGTQYNDMKGTSALDWDPPDNRLHSFSSELGIDTERFFPVAMNIYYEKGFSHFEIYTVEKTPESEPYENLVEYAESREGRLPVVKFSKSYNINDFLNKFKRLSIFLNSLHRSPSISDFEIVDERNID